MNNLLYILLFLVFLGGVESDCFDSEWDKLKVLCQVMLLMSFLSVKKLLFLPTFYSCTQSIAQTTVCTSKAAPFPPSPSPSSSSPLYPCSHWYAFSLSTAKHYSSVLSHGWGCLRLRIELMGIECMREVPLLRGFENCVWCGCFWGTTVWVCSWAIWWLCGWGGDHGSKGSWPWWSWGITAWKIIIWR